MTSPRRILARAALALALAPSACMQPAVQTGPGFTSRVEGARELGDGLSTSGSSEGSVVFAVKGDWGAGTPAQWQVTRQMCQTRDQASFDVVMTTGDNFYSPDGVATPRTYDNPERCLVSDPEHRWLPAWGNHDLRGTSTSNVLSAPARRYVWATGEAQVVVLDSNRAWEGGQRRWLARSLRRSPAPVKIAVLHHPPFSTSGHGSQAIVRESWVPLFERHGVDLVLSGHNHLYEHARVGGVDYVVTGGGGAWLDPCGAPAPWTRRCVSAHHFVLVAAAEGTLSVRALAPSGRVLDSFSVTA